jgi:hypothetical protein
LQDGLIRGVVGSLKARVGVGRRAWVGGGLMIRREITLFGSPAAFARLPR